MKYESRISGMLTRMYWEFLQAGGEDLNSGFSLGGKHM